MVAKTLPDPEQNSLTRIARRMGLDLGTLAVLIGLTLTTLAYFWARSIDQQREAEVFRLNARAMAAAVQKRLDSSFELMQTVPALFNVKPDASEVEFGRFVKLAGSSYAAIQWAPRLTEAERPEFERRAQAAGMKDFEIREAKGAGMLVRASVRSTYVPLLYIEPPNPEVLGFDLWSENTRRGYVERCRDSGRAVVSERFELIEEELPTPALAIYLPVYALGQPISTQQQRRDAFSGVAVGVLPLADLVPRALAGFDIATLDVALIDTSAKTEEAELLFESSLGAKVGVEASAMAATFPLTLGDRELSVMLSPGIGYQSVAPRYRFHVALSGLALTLLSALGLAVLRSRRVISQATRTVEQLGQYEVLEELGRGGMGVVYKAQHSTLRRATAIKLLLKPSDSLKRRFEREARVTSRLCHPNTVQVYDYGRTPDGALYYAMEYVSGVSLSELVKSEGPQPAGRVVHLLTQIAGSLAEAHTAGLVHRDIKPANVMIQSKGGVPDHVTVLDFGLVRDLTMEETLTARQMPVGTPSYMSPEQIRDEAVSASSDLYAVGGLAYYLLTGTPPFQGATAVEVCMGHLKQQPTPPSERLGQSIPAELESLVLSLLAKEAAQRPASAIELLRQLEALSGFTAWSREQARLWWSGRSSDAAEEIEAPRSSGRRTITVDFSSR